MTLQQRHFVLHAEPPFAFSHVLEYLRRSPSTILEVITPEEYRRGLVLNGRRILLTVRAAGSVEEPVLLVTLDGEDIGDGEEAQAKTWVRRLFMTDVASAPFYEEDSKDPVLAALARTYYGLRPVLIPDLFEALVWAIIGQQINVRFAAKCKRALVERFGQHLTLDGSRYQLFPGPERLASLLGRDLLDIQFSRQKTRYILDMARQVAAGDLRLEELRDLPAAEAQKRLEGLLGVGRWTAEYVLLRGLGCRDAIPAGDGGLRRVIGMAYGLGRSATEAEVRELAERWVGWRGYAAFLWWHAAQQTAAGRLAQSPLEQHPRAGYPPAPPLDAGR